jgi:hypothetical protein
MGLPKAFGQNLNIACKVAHEKENFLVWILKA